MKIRLVSSVFALLSCLSPSTVIAQASNTPQGMESNSWKILTKDFNDDRLGWLYGTQGHVTEQSLIETMSLQYPYGAYIGRNLYPNADPSFDLSQSDCAGLSKANLDDILLNASNTIDWLQEKGFEKNDRYFNIVPDYRPSGSRKQGWVNLIVCKNSAGVAYILNKKNAEQSNFLGLKKSYSTVLNHPIHKMVIPHELMHVYQMNFMPHVKKGTKEDTAVKTIREGLADAAGLMSVFDRYGGGGSLEDRQKRYLSNAAIKGFEDDFSRRMFMIRAYNVPLQVNEGNTKNLNAKWSDKKGKALIQAVDEVVQERMSYYSSGFFYHLLERYLREPGDITQLYKKFDTYTDTKNIYPNLDAFLKTKSKVKTNGPVIGLVLTQFLTEYSEWWNFRTAGKIPEQKWLDVSFGKCPKIRLDETKITNHKETDMSKFSGGCFDIILDEKLADRFPELELLVSSQDGDPDRVYLGLARIKKGGTRLYSCYENAQNQSSRGTFPCLLNPLQGDTARKVKSLAGTKIRAFSVPPLEGPMMSGAMTLRVVLADVPNKLSGKGHNSRRAEAATYRLTASVDSAVVKGHGVPKSKAAAKSQTSRQGRLREARPPRLARADGPLSPTGTKIMMTATMRDLLNQGVGIPMGGNGDMQDGIAQKFFQIETSTDQEDGPQLMIMTQEDYFGTGAIGRFPVQGLYQFKDELGQQNPNKKSELNIMQNSEEALAYEATLHVCTYRANEMLVRTVGQKTFDPCRDGTPRTYEIKNSVAFPALLPGRVSGIGAFVADEASQALRDYQNVRLARLGMSDAINSQATSPDDSGSGRSDGLVGSSGATTSGGTGTTQPLCKIRDAAQICDCSCEAKVCFDSKTTSQTLQPQEKACRLTCGKRWKPCPVSGSTP